jgi:hypothetical protein
MLTHDQLTVLFLSAVVSSYTYQSILASGDAYFHPVQIGTGYNKTSQIRRKCWHLFFKWWAMNVEICVP